MNKSIISNFNYNDIYLSNTFTSTLNGCNTVSSALQKIDQLNVIKTDSYAHKLNQKHVFENQICAINLDVTSLKNYKIVYNIINTELPSDFQGGLFMRYNNIQSSIYKGCTYRSELPNLGVTAGSSVVSHFTFNEFRVESADTRKLTVLNGTFLGKIEGNLNVNTSRMIYFDGMNARTNGTVFWTSRMLYEFEDRITPITTLNIYTYHRITGEITISSY